MIYTMKSPNISAYLEASEFIDFDHPKVRIIADYLQERLMQRVSLEPNKILYDPELELARLTYLLVRDEVAFTYDIGKQDVTIKASDVLTKKHSGCFGKSHLLAALMRANGIPAAVCYQYLRLDDGDNAPLILHALNAICPESVGRWFRLDARGNNDSVSAEFCIDEERIAYPVDPGRGETDLSLLFAKPDYSVIRVLNQYTDASVLRLHLPDKIAGRYWES